VRWCEFLEFEELPFRQSSGQSRFRSTTGVNWKCFGGNRGQTSPPASYSSLENPANSEKQVQRAADPRSTPASHDEARPGKTRLRTTSFGSHSNMVSLLLATARPSLRGIVYDDGRAKFVRESSGYFTQPSVRRSGFHLRAYLRLRRTAPLGISLLFVRAIDPLQEEHSDDPS